MKGIQNTSSKTYRQMMGNGIRYEIPKFQRDYTWQIEHWDDLWQDIKALLSDNDEEHYMGYLVLQTVNNKEFQIIDGQQRLTTMSLLILATLKCINEIAQSGVDTENNLKRKDSLMNSYIGYVDPVTLISNNKLKLNRNAQDLNYEGKKPFCLTSNFLLTKDIVNQYESWNEEKISATQKELAKHAKSN